MERKLNHDHSLEGRGKEAKTDLSISILMSICAQVDQIAINITEVTLRPLLKPYF